MLIRLLALLTFLAPAAWGQDESAQYPILVVDQERLFAESRLGRQISSDLEQRAEALAAENRRIEGELSAEEQALTQRRATLSPTEFRELADAFDAKVQGLRAEQDQKARDITRLRDRERQLLLNSAGPVLGAIANERGALIILDRRNVLISADSIDITDDAIARLNERLEADAQTQPGGGDNQPVPGASD